MKKIFAHFESVDPILSQALARLGEIDLTSQKKNATDYFIALCESIVSQQLSVKVADVIWARVVALMPDQKISPEHILAIDTEVFRAQGMSYSKIKYIKDLAQKVVDKEIDLSLLDSLPNEEVITTLTKVKGIGRWTAEMFLMFALARPDIFSTGDLGLKRAIQKLYGLESEPDEKTLLVMSAKWAPYRTYAARILWKSLDNEPKIL